MKKSVIYTRMKKINIVLIILLSIIVASCSDKSRKGQLDDYFSLKFAEISSPVPEEQEYEATFKRVHLNPLTGETLSLGDVVRAKYHVYDNDVVKWSEVYKAPIAGLSQTEFDGEYLTGFDGFSYKLISDDFLNADFYDDIPDIHRPVAEMLVSDAMQLHGIMLYIIDSLEYKKDYVPDFMINNNIEYEGSTTFSSSYQRYTWTGLTEHNGKLCAMIEFESAFNPIGNANPDFSTHGRSTYHGEFRVSLADKQIEYSMMFEDLVYEFTNNLNRTTVLRNDQRLITFDKIR